MRAAPLTTVKDGINRLRTKGGARADALYDLVNGYVTEARTVKVRPGTERVTTLDPLTRGLCAHDGELHTFCHELVDIPAGFQVHVLWHPDSIVDDRIALEKIHFARPFMGALYVVAEFEDGAVYHYWLQQGEQWEAQTMYRANDLVVPTVPNGFVYMATRLGAPYPAWAPNVPRHDGTDSYEQSIVEPTTYNDFFYRCVATTGNNPRSGTVEPLWPTEDGQQITETVNATGETAVAGTPVPPDPGPTTPERDRYGTYATNSRGGGRVNIP